MGAPVRRGEAIGTPFPEFLVSSPRGFWGLALNRISILEHVSIPVKQIPTIYGELWANHARAPVLHNSSTVQEEVGVRVFVCFFFQIRNNRKAKWLD